MRSLIPTVMRSFRSKVIISCVFTADDNRACLVTIALALRSEWEVSGIERAITGVSARVEASDEPAVFLVEVSLIDP